MKHKILVLKTCLMLLLALFGLVACDTTNNALPLADGQPTLLFFYTDN